MMGKYLLDTNICVFLLRGLYGITERLELIGRENCRISEITVGELLYGAACSANPQKHIAQIDKIIKLFATEPIYPVLPVFAKTKAQLRKNGRLIDDFDLLIGSTALRNEMTLVTDNVKHLSHIPNLQIENWVDREKAKRRF